MKPRSVNLNSSDIAPITIKADPELLKIIDEMRRKQTDLPSRTQMIIRTIKWAFAHDNGDITKITTKAAS